MTESEKDKQIVELQDTIREMLKERFMNITTILLIINGIRLLQSMKDGEELTNEKMLKLIVGIFGVSGNDAKVVAEILKDLDPEFLGKVLHGLGDLVEGILRR